MRSVNNYMSIARSNIGDSLKLYKESKGRALLDKIKAWFKKAWEYLKKKASQIKEWVVKLFTRKNKKAKVVKTGHAGESYSQALLILSESVSTTQKTAEIIAEGIEEGIKSMARDIFSKDNLKYGGADIKDMATTIVESAYRDLAKDNRRLDELRETRKDLVEFWKICKGTPYEQSVVSALVVMFICSTGVYPYMPSKLVEYVSRQTDGDNKLNGDDIFKGVGFGASDSVSGDLMELVNDVLTHISGMYNVVTKTAWGVDVKNANVLFPYKVDGIIKSTRNIADILNNVDELSESDVRTGKDVIDLINKIFEDIGKNMKVFDGVIAEPKSILANIKLDTLITKKEFYSSQLDVFRIIEMYDYLADTEAVMDNMLNAITKEFDSAELKSEAFIADVYKTMINGINPIMKASNSLGIAAAVMFRSLSDVEEEMVGFYGASISEDSVPVTAIAKAIAGDKALSAKFIKKLGL